MRCAHASSEGGGRHQEPRVLSSLWKLARRGIRNPRRASRKEWGPAGPQGGLLDSCAPHGKTASLWALKALGLGFVPAAREASAVDTAFDGHTLSHAPWGVGARTSPGKCPLGCGTADNLLFECEPY